MPFSKPIRNWPAKMVWVIGASSGIGAAFAQVRGFERGDFEIHFPKRFTRWLKFLRLLPHRLYFPIIHRFTGL